MPAVALVVRAEESSIMEILISIALFYVKFGGTIEGSMTA